MGTSNDYLIVYRKPINVKNAKEEKVIDLLEIPLIRREY
jgi:hypothetical protein